MPVSDDDYKRRLASRISRGSGSLGPTWSPSMIPYQAKATEPSLRFRLDNPQRDMPQFMPGPVGAAGIGRIALTAAAEEGGPLLARIATPVIRDAIEVARTEGRAVAGDLYGSWALQGARRSPAVIDDAARAAEEELYNFIGELDRMGVKPQTANRLLRSFATHPYDEVEAAVIRGEDLARSAASGMSAKHALIMRMFDRIGSAAENAFGE